LSTTANIDSGSEPDSKIFASVAIHWTHEASLLRHVAVAITSVVVIGCGLSPDSSSANANVKPPQAPVLNNAEPAAPSHDAKVAAATRLSFTILRDESESNGIHNLVRKHILVQGSPVNGETLNELLNSIYAKEKAERPSDSSNWQLAIYAYGDRGHFEGGAAQWAGMMLADGDDAPKITISDRVLNPPSADKRRLKRYSAEKEHEIFYALCKAQDKAEAESYNSHPRSARLRGSKQHATTTLREVRGELAPEI